MAMSTMSRDARIAEEEGPGVGRPRKITVVVPVFDGARTLVSLVDRLEQVLAEVADAFEVLLVDDGSADGSWSVIRTLAAERVHVRGVRLMRNFGQHNATLCGLHRAKNAVVVTLDDDLQQPPEELPALIEKLENGWDLVYGVPRIRRHGGTRSLCIRIGRGVLFRGLGVESLRHASSFRALRGGLVHSLRNQDSPCASIDVALHWSTTRIAAVQVRHDPRLHGHSSYSVWRLAAYAVDLVFESSRSPIKGLAALGLASVVTGTVLLLAAGWIPDGTPGLLRTIYAPVLVLLSGVHLLAVAVLGEYLRRVHERSSGRPAYVVREETDP